MSQPPSEFLAAPRIPWLEATCLPTPRLCLHIAFSPLIRTQVIIFRTHSNNPGEAPPLKILMVVQWIGIYLPLQGTQVQSWSRKISQATEQLSPRTTASEPERYSHRSLPAYSPCSATREATAVRSPCPAVNSSPCSRS